jgi:hypothetical protein
MELTLSLKVILSSTLNLEAIISDLCKFPAEKKARPQIPEETENTINFPAHTSSYRGNNYYPKPDQINQ